jgi:DNA-binding transcriptional LysR family regulator
MNLDDVRVFVKLAELGNFTRVGEQLGIASVVAVIGARKCAG